MKKKGLLFILVFFLSFSFQLAGQDIKTSLIGINIFQLPAGTLNVNYSLEPKPFFTVAVDAGYTFNYIAFEKTDLIGYLLTRHNDLYDGYYLKKQSGGYLKLGGFLNLRNDFSKRNYFHLGIFLTNALAYEEGYYQDPSDSQPYTEADRINHRVFLFGLGSSVGYEFSLGKRLKCSTDYQLTWTSNMNELYSYTHFVPGMGATGCTAAKFFPMLMLNLKYCIKS
jgi:hypothetical protein